MPILDRYIFKELVTNYLVCLLGLLAFIVAFTWLDHLHRHNFSWIIVWSFYKYAILEYASYMIVVAQFLSCLISYSGFSRDLELVAMATGGISTLRIFSPAISLAFAISTVHLMVNDNWSIPAKIRYVEIREKVFTPEHQMVLDPVTFSLSNIWIRHDNSFMNFGSSSSDGKSITGIRIYSLDDNGHMQQFIYGLRGEYSNGHWDLFDGWSATFANHQAPPVRKKFDKMPIQFLSTPEQVKKVIPTPSGMRLADLRRFIDRNRAAGVDETSMNVEFHYRVAFSFACLVFTLLALPFCTKSSRNQNLAVNIGICFFFVVCYWSTFQLFRSMGVSQTLPPVVAAWAANFLFGGGALYLLYSKGTIR